MEAALQNLKEKEALSVALARFVGVILSHHSVNNQDIRCYNANTSVNVENIDYSVLSRYILNAEFCNMNLADVEFYLTAFGCLRFYKCDDVKSQTINSFVKMLGCQSCNIQEFTVTPNLINLRRLDLVDCELTAVHNIGILQNLEHLDLSNNKITDLPDDFYELKNIEFLDLARNNLSKISYKIVNMKNLEELFIWYNDITELPNLHGLPKLRMIGLSYNKLSILPVGIENIAHRKCENNPVFNEAFRAGFRSNVIEYSNYKRTAMYVERHFPTTFNLDYNTTETLLSWVQVAYVQN